MSQTADLPYQRDRSSERRALFSRCDPNGNGYCSVAEIFPILRRKYGFGDKDEMPLIEAFDEAKNFSGKESGVSSGYIEYGEFRVFLEILLKKLGAKVVPQTPAKSDIVVAGPKVKAAPVPAAFKVDLPYQRDQLKARQALYAECDHNGNGYCSVAEIDAIMKQKFKFGDAQSSPLLHAFDEAKNFGGKETGVSGDYIEHGEFRIFLELLMKKLGMKVVPQSPAKENLIINHPKVKGKGGGKAQKTDDAKLGSPKGSGKGGHYLTGAKVGSLKGFICAAGQIVAIPHSKPGKSSSLPNLRPRFDGTSEAQHKYAELPHSYCSMDKKPLCPYDPKASRNRLAVDDAPVPYKNASTIQFNGGIHVVHKNQFKTSQQSSFNGEPVDMRSHPGILATSSTVRRKLREM